MIKIKNKLYLIDINGYLLNKNMKVEYTNPRNLKENPTNPRNITDLKFNKLVKSIKSFPQMLELRPLVVDSEMVVLGGNMRLKACIEAGLDSIPYIKVDDLTEEQKKEFIIKDNIGYGEWNWDIIVAEWDTTKLDDWGLDVIKHDWDDLDYIDEDQDLELKSKKNVITVIVDDSYIDDIKNIESDIKDLLQEKYSGCEIR